MNTLRVVDLEETSPSCPTQWEGVTDDGRHLYFRYRWGRWSLGVGATKDEALFANTLSGGTGERMDGTCSLPEWLSWVRARGIRIEVACSPRRCEE